MKKVYKTKLSLNDIKKELSAIAQGQYKLGPLEADLRVKALKNLADIILKEKQAGIEQKKSVKPITVTVVNSETEDQEKRIKEIEKSLKAQAKSEGAI